MKLKNFTTLILAGTIVFLGSEIAVFTIFSPEPYRYALMIGILVVYIAFRLVIREIILGKKACKKD